MKALGIIAEYNPFHNGHAYQIVQAKKLHGGPVVVVLSGDFVQRGEVAVFDKFMRARHALLNGADMVLQLPTVFSLASAQRFAAGGVALLNGSGIVDTVCFGSECGDLSKLQKARAAMGRDNGEFSASLRAHLCAGLSYPAAAEKAAGSAYLAGANDLLAIEYLRSMEHTSLRPLCVLREGARHDEARLDTPFASAGALRQMLYAGEPEKTAEFVPEEVYATIETLSPRREERLSPVLLYALRRMDVAALSRLPDVSEGLENVLYKQCRANSDYTAFLFACKSKRYTMARLKRIAMCALLSIEKSDLARSPYIRVLGIRSEARPLLAELCRKSDLPVVARYADVKALPPEQLRLHEIDMLASQTVCIAAEESAAFDYGAPLLTV